MSDIRKTLDKLNEMTAGSVATVATPLFKETVKREKTDETADSGKKYMNSVERGASEWGNWASSKKKKTVAEATTPTTDDDKLRTMLQTVTSKKAVKKQQKANTKQKASDAFASMFGGGNPAGTLGIRKEGVAKDINFRELLKDPQGDKLITNVPKFLFHATPSKNVDSIKSKGLELRSDNPQDKYEPRIYVANNFVDALKISNQLRQALKSKQDYTILKINTNGLKNNFYVDPYYSGGAYTDQNISPDSISVEFEIPKEAFRTKKNWAQFWNWKVWNKEEPSFIKQGVEEGWKEKVAGAALAAAAMGAFGNADAKASHTTGDEFSTPIAGWSTKTDKAGNTTDRYQAGPIDMTATRNAQGQRVHSGGTYQVNKTAAVNVDVPYKDGQKGIATTVGRAANPSDLDHLMSADAVAKRKGVDPKAFARFQQGVEEGFEKNDQPLFFKLSKNGAFDVYKNSPNGPYRVGSITHEKNGLWYGSISQGSMEPLIQFQDKNLETVKEKMINAVKNLQLKTAIKLSEMPNQGVNEGWKISTPIDKERYTDMSDQGLEGPFRLKSGKIVYYDPKEGKYYDRDTDMYMDYDEYQSHTNEEALMELGYEGNIGAMEMVKFFKMADPRQKEILNQLIKEKEFQRAWALIQGVTGDKLVGKEFSEGEIAEQLSEDLRAWFGKGGEGGAGGGGWDRYNTKGERIGKCGERKEGEGKPKCLSKEKAASLRASGGKKAIAAAVRKKRREDPNPQRQGKADMVSNKTKNESLEYYVKEGICPQCNGEMVSEALFTEGKKDACYHKVKSRYKIWPSAYASGALVKCRKAGAKNWGNKSKNESINEGRADDLERALMQARKITKGIAYDNTVNEIMVEIENLVKAYALDMDDFNYHNSRVYEAKHELESAIYGLDEIFEDALRDAKFSDEESINEADPARRGFLGSLGKAAAAGAAMAAGGKALGQEKRSVNISVEEADNQIKALRNQAYQDLASMVWSVWPYILDKKFGNVTPEDDIPNAEEIGKIISNRIGRKLEEYAREYRKKVHMIKVNAGITDPNTLYKTSAMLESLTEDDLSEQDLIVMPGKMRMRGDVVKAKHMEPDHEVSMAVNSLLSTIKNAMSLAKIIKGRSEGQGLPGWVSDHITRADELIKDVAEYMEGHEAQKNMLEGKKNVKR